MSNKGLSSLVYNFVNVIATFGAVSIMCHLIHLLLTGPALLLIFYFGFSWLYSMAAVSVAYTLIVVSYMVYNGALPMEEEEES